MTDALQIVGGLLTPLIAIIALYIAVQQHTLQRDKLRLDLYEKRLAVFDATMQLLGSVQTEGVGTKAVIYKFITDTSNARFLFGVAMEEYLLEVARQAIDQLWLYEKVVREQKEGKTDTVELESAALKKLMAEQERARELFQPYLGFAVRGSTESESNELVFFRLMILAAVVSALGLGASALLTRQQGRRAHATGSAYFEIVKKREQVCDSAPQSLLCDASTIKEYRKNMDKAFDSWGELDSQSDRLFMLAWAAPLGCVLAFYAGRWVVTAKVRPFRPLRESV